MTVPRLSKTLDRWAKDSPSNPAWLPVVVTSSICSPRGLHGPGQWVVGQCGLQAKLCPKFACKTSN